MAFPYRGHHPLLLDSAYLPNSPMEMPLLPQQIGGLSNASSSFPYSYSSGAMPEASLTDTRAYDSSSSLDTYTNTCSVDSQQEYSVKQKRKNKEETRLITSQSKGSKEGKSWKYEKPRVRQKEAKNKNPKADDSKATKACGETPAGYIHVRARRGQATDSHSLAERVRREKISERMKTLQGLVPGCDKVTGKAHMLDEIINYVQSLQNQVEFLSMKLASLSPILYDFSLDFDGCTNPPEKMMRRITPGIYANQAIQPQPTTYEDETTNGQMMNHSAPLLMEEPGSTTFHQTLILEDDGSSVMQVDTQRQGFLNQREFINMCSFHQ